MSTDKSISTHTCRTGHALNSMLQVKTLYHTHQNLLKPNQVSERSAYHLQNYTCFSPLTSGESLATNLLPKFDKPWIEAYCPKF